MSAREVSLGKMVQGGSVGSSDPRPSFEQTYQLGKELGHGSFSTVREGTHKVHYIARDGAAGGGEREGMEGMFAREPSTNETP